MEAVAYSHFRQNLKSYLKQVNEDSEPLIVTNKNPEDNVVVMSKDDYDSMMETMRIDENPYLRDKVLRGMAQIKRHETVVRDLIEVADD